MFNISVRVPLRADLAGGTLDLWPLYLFHPGARTVNVAISLHAECEISSTGDQTIEVWLTDLGYRQRYDSIEELSNDPEVALIAGPVRHFGKTGLRIVTRTDAPRGSGLGGSSALVIALVRGLSESVGEPVEGEALIALVRDLETRLIGIPAGIQDYYPAVYGGLASLHLDPGAPVRVPIRLPLHDLASRFVLHYSDVSHFSGTNNWQIYKRHIDGKHKVREGLAKIAATAEKMETALEASDFEAAGAALAEEWTNRRALVDGISTPEIDSAVEAAVGAGAYGGKVCGAGGGGCIVFLCPPDRRDAVIAALSKVAGNTIAAVPVNQGLAIIRQGEKQAVFAAATSRARARTDAIEHLYVDGEGDGRYEPFILAEGAVTFEEPRGGIRLSRTRTAIAPIDWAGVQIDWTRASFIGDAELKVSAVPDPDRKFAISQDDAVLTEAVSQVDDAFRQLLEERERVTICHNPDFGIYSESGESRDEFVARCREIARRSLEDETQRLESTYRRRIDQVKEKQEKEERSREEGSPEEEVPNDVNIQWGQTLYNITSGKPTRTVAAGSVRELDYMERISQIQKNWQRELESLQDQVDEKAQHVEEIVLIPQSRNVETRRVVVLWIGGLKFPDDLVSSPRSPR